MNKCNLKVLIKNIKSEFVSFNKIIKFHFCIFAAKRNLY